MDHEALASQLVRALRGDRSQVALSRRLNYAGNTVYLWERGRRFPTPASFFWLAHRTGVDVHDVLDRFMRQRTRDQGEPWTVPGAAAFMRDLQGTHSAAELARQLGCSRQSMARWMRGETEPRLPDFLRLMQCSTTRTLDFVRLLVDPLDLPAAAEAWRRLVTARALVSENPWTAAVELALELEDYRALPAHEDGWIARRLGLRLSEERRCLELLAEAGKIRREHGRWEPTHVEALDMRGPGARQRLTRWWSEVGTARITTAEGALVGWNLFNVSEEDLERIRRMQREHYRAVRNVVENSPRRERLVITNLQLIPLDTLNPDALPVPEDLSDDGSPAPSPASPEP